MNLEVTTVQVFWDVSLTNLEQPDCDAVSLEDQKKVRFNSASKTMN